MSGSKTFEVRVTIVAPQEVKATEVESLVREGLKYAQLQIPLPLVGRDPDHRHGTILADAPISFGRLTIKPNHQEFP